MSAATMSARRAPRREQLRLAWKKAGQLFCRHAYQLVVWRHRVFLRCSVCGRESQGYAVD